MANAATLSIIKKMNEKTKKICQPAREKKRLAHEQHLADNTHPPRYIIVTLGGSVHRGMGRTRFALR